MIRTIRSIESSNFEYRIGIESANIRLIESSNHRISNIEFECSSNYSVSLVLRHPVPVYHVLDCHISRTFNPPACSKPLVQEEDGSTEEDDRYHYGNSELCLVSLYVSRSTPLSKSLFSKQNCREREALVVAHVWVWR